MFNSVKTNTFICHSHTSHGCKGNKQEREFINVNMYYDENDKWDAWF